MLFVVLLFSLPVCSSEYSIDCPLQEVRLKMIFQLPHCLLCSAYHSIGCFVVSEAMQIFIMYIASVCLCMCCSVCFVCLLSSSLAPSSTWRTGANQDSAKTAAHVTHHALVKALLEKYQINETQLLLRWALQHNYCILPKSSKPDRVEQNTQLFHFEIEEGDMAALDGLDQNLALAWPIGNPLDFGL